MANFKECGVSGTFVLERLSAKDVARALIESGKQKEPFHIFDMNEVYNHILHFMKMMPRVKIFFAMKANNHPMLMKLITALGHGFDCASPGEIKYIIELGVHPRSIIYTMPSKHPDHMIFARNCGVRHATFDTSYELKKMKQYWPDVSLLIRIRVDSDSIYKLGEKFGADPETEATDLLDDAASLGLRVAGVAFHVGSVCFSPESFDTALRCAHKLFVYEARAGRRMTILDIGGGFLSETINIIDKASKIINSTIEELFPDTDVQIITEPGRYICDTSFSLYSNINNVRRHSAKIDDDNEPPERALLYGPSCDYEDRIMRNFDIRFPKISPLDWLVFTFQGSYTINFQSKFSCIQMPQIRNVVSADLWNKIKSHPVFNPNDFIVDPDISTPLLSTLPPVPEKNTNYVMNTPLLT